MSLSQRAIPAGPVLAVRHMRHKAWHAGLWGTDYAWALAFAVPYTAIFLFFVVYPVGYGLWLGSDPALLAQRSAVAGLIKTSLALARQTLPASIGWTAANPAIDFARSPFRVQTATTSWPRGTVPRRAGVRPRRRLDRGRSPRRARCGRDPCGRPH